MMHSAQEIQDWLVVRVSTLAGVAPEEIDVNAPVRRFGLDSVAVVTMVADLETWLSLRIQENPLEQHRTIAALAQYLAEKQEPAG
jgi:acyl carrier protein